MGAARDTPQDFWGAIFSSYFFPDHQQLVEETALGELQFTNEHLVTVTIP